MGDIFEIWEVQMWNAINWAERNLILARDNRSVITEIDLRSAINWWAIETGGIPLKGGAFRSTFNRMGYPKGPAHNYIRTRVGLRLIRPTTPERAQAVNVAKAILFG